MEMSDIETMINHAANQDFNAANGIFQELISQRMSDALDQEKINVAGQIFNQADEEPEEYDDEFEDAEQLELELDDEEDENKEADITDDEDE